MDHIGITIVSVAFWVFVGVVSVAGIAQEYRKRKATLDLVRVAIERGQQLSPEVIDRLLDRDHQKSEEMNPRDLRIGGIITCASGIGVTLMSLLWIAVFPRYYGVVVLGAGVLGICVGVGLLIAAKSLQR